MKAKKRLSNINFSSEDSHMALVGVSNGGPANGVKTLILKSNQEFSPEQLKSLTQIVVNSQGVSEEEAQEIVSKNFNQTKGEPMSEQPVEKSEENTFDAQEALREQIQKAKEQEEIVKGLQAEIEKFRQREEQVTKAKFVTKAKEFESLGVTDENVDDVAVALMKMSDDETMKPVQDILEKALNIAKANSEGVFTEKGHDAEVETDGEESGVMKALKAKKASK